MLAVEIDPAPLPLELYRQRHDTPLFQGVAQRGVVGTHELDEKGDRVVACNERGGAECHLQGHHPLVPAVVAQNPGEGAVGAGVGRSLRERALEGHRLAALHRRVTS